MTEANFYVGLSVGWCVTEKIQWTMFNILSYVNSNMNIIFGSVHHLFDNCTRVCLSFLPDISEKEVAEVVPLLFHIFDD